MSTRVQVRRCRYLSLPPSSLSLSRKSKVCEIRCTCRFVCAGGHGARGRRLLAKEAEKGRREKEKNWKSAVMQTQINRKNIIIERKREERDSKTEWRGGHSRRGSTRGTARQKGSKVAHSPSPATHTCFCVGRCVRFVSRRAALLRGGSSKEGPDKGLGMRGPRPSTSRDLRFAARMPHAPEVENLPSLLYSSTDSLLSTKIERRRIANY